MKKIILFGLIFVFLFSFAYAEKNIVFSNDLSKNNNLINIDNKIKLSVPQIKENKYSSKNNKKTYENIIENMDISYTILPSLIKEEIIIKSKPKKETIEFNLEILNDYDVINGEIWIYPSTSLHIAETRILKPFYTYKGKEYILNMTYKNNIYSINISPILEIDSSEFPITIDPSFDFASNCNESETEINCSGILTGTYITNVSKTINFRNVTWTQSGGAVGTSYKANITANIFNCYSSNITTSGQSGQTSAPATSGGQGRTFISTNYLNIENCRILTTGGGVGAGSYTASGNSGELYISATYMANISDFYFSNSGGSGFQKGGSANGGKAIIHICSESINMTNGYIGTAGGSLTDLYCDSPYTSNGDSIIYFYGDSSGCTNAISPFSKYLNLTKTNVYTYANPGESTHATCSGGAKTFSAPGIIAYYYTNFLKEYYSNTTISGIVSSNGDRYSQFLGYINSTVIFQNSKLEVQYPTTSGNNISMYANNVKTGFFNFTNANTTLGKDLRITSNNDDYIIAGYYNLNDLSNVSFYPNYFALNYTDFTNLSITISNIEITPSLILNNDDVIGNCEVESAYNQTYTITGRFYKNGINVSEIQQEYDYSNTLQLTYGYENTNIGDNFTFSCFANNDYSSFGWINTSVSQVKLFAVDNCSNTYNQPTNATAYIIRYFDIETGTQLSGNIYGTLNYYFGESYYLNSLNNYNVSLCIYPNEASESVISNLYYGATGYGSKVYSLSETFSNDTQYLDLYLLNSSSANLGRLIVHVFDDSYNLITGANVKLLEYSPSLSSFIQTSECFSDTNGECIFNVELNTKFYIVTATAELDGIVYSAQSTETGQLIAIDGTTIDLPLKTSNDFNLDNLFSLVIIPYNTSLIGNTSYLSASFNDASNINHTVCIGYYILNGLNKIEQSSTCVTGSAGIVNAIGGYILDRTYTWVAKIYVIKEDGTTIDYNQYVYQKLEGGLSSFILFLKPVILTLLLSLLAISLYLKNINIFAIGEMILSVSMPVIYPSLIGGVTMAFLIILGIIILYFTSRKEEVT